MKTIAIFAVLMSVQAASASNVIRSSPQSFTRYTLQGVPAYNVDEAKEANRVAENKALQAALEELENGCSQFQSMDIANVTITPAQMGAVDETVTLEVTAVCKGSGNGSEIGFY